MHSIAIVGSGFSGTMVAVHLLANCGATPTTIMLIERTGRFTAGVAYGTQCNLHLLNVPAGRMSALENDQGHFLRWAQSRDARIHGGTFVPRRLYGAYLAHLLSDAERHAHPHVQLLRIPGEAISIAPARHDQMVIQLTGGGCVRAEHVVLAIGNFPPANPWVEDQSFYQNALYTRDPWAADALNVAPDEDVLLVGTGLTMFDIALALRDRGHRGRMIAISRRGLMPQPHRDSATPPPSHPRPANIEQWPRTAAGLLHKLRHEIRTAALHNVDWREVVTSVRHDTAPLWQSLPISEKKRFLSHLRPFWEVHRHRAAPLIANQISMMINAGQLEVLAARLIGFDAEDANVNVRIRPRGGRRDVQRRVGRVINCTGPDTDLSRVEEPLIVNLRESGMIRPDALGLGLETDETGAVINASGHPCRRLFLVGPLRKGQLWENTAVPELRMEAERLAARLAHAPTPVNRTIIDAGFAMQC